MNIIETLEKEQLRNDIPEFRPGDTVRVHVKVVEGKNERIQMYEGVVIARKNAGLRETFTVRRISYGVGVERTFLVHSPRLEKIEVRRAASFVVQSSSICADSPAKLLVSKKENKFSKKAAARAAAFLMGPKGGCMAADSNKNS